MGTRRKRSGSDEDRPEAQKPQYRVKNWSQYDRALVARGDLTLWFDDEAIEEVWKGRKTGKPGRSFTYSEAAIQTVLTIKAVFHLTNRTAEGFTASLMKKLGHDLPAPDHTLLSRRSKTLVVAIPRRMPQEGLHLVIDSTGLKVYGEGEWKVKKHGAEKRRTWRKVHLGADAETGEILAVEVTGAGGDDAESLPELLEQMPESVQIEQVSADGAYDRRKVYEALAEREITPAIPPREGAVFWEEGHPRNEAVEAIKQDGFRSWAERAGYFARSRAENAVYRLKRLLGSALSSRGPEQQTCEVHVRVACLNRMTHLGRPRSVRVAPVA